MYWTKSKYFLDKIHFILMSIPFPNICKFRFEGSMYKIPVSLGYSKLAELHFCCRRHSCSLLCKSGCYQTRQQWQTGALGFLCWRAEPMGTQAGLQGWDPLTPERALLIGYMKKIHWTWNELFIFPSKEENVRAKAQMETTALFHLRT